MRFSLVLNSFTVHTDYISVRTTVKDPSEDTITLLKELKGKKKKMWFENTNVGCKIESINVTKHISLTIHTEKERYVAVKLYELSEQKKPFNFFVKSDIEEKLHLLLKEISEKTGRSKGDILEEVSAFFNKNGVLIPGKRSVYDLTTNWQKTVESKLSGMLRDKTAA